MSVLLHFNHFCLDNVVNVTICVFILKTYPSAGELSAMAGLKSAVQSGRQYFRGRLIMPVLSKMIYYISK